MNEKTEQQNTVNINLFRLISSQLKNKRWRKKTRIDL